MHLPVVIHQHPIKARLLSVPGNGKHHPDFSKQLVIGRCRVQGSIINQALRHPGMVVGAEHIGAISIANCRLRARLFKTL